MRVIDRRNPRTGHTVKGSKGGRYAIKWHGGNIELVEGRHLLFPSAYRKP